MFTKSGYGYFSLPLKTWSQARFLTLRWMEMSLGKKFSISNGGIARIQAFLWEKHLIFLFLLLLGVLKPACTERALEIQSYLDT